MAETRDILDQLIEENRVALVEARDKLGNLQIATEDSNNRQEETTDQERSEIMKAVCRNKQYKWFVIVETWPLKILLWQVKLSQLIIL